MKKVILSLITILLLCCVIFHKKIQNIFEELDIKQKATIMATGIDEADTNVPDVGTGYYAYHTLTEDEQLIYNQMADCLKNYEEDATLSTYSEEVADRVFTCLINDHPEIFWISAYKLTTYQFMGIESELVFQPVYSMSYREIKEYEKDIDIAVTQCLEGIPENADEYTIAKYLYEYLILQTDYSKEAENNQNICSVFLNKESVCMGYAKAYQYLLQKMNIQSVIITGKTQQEAHAWNLVKLQDAYYFVDVTWADPEFRMATENNADYIDYGFFCITTETLNQTHTIDSSFPIPECTANDCNYYRKEGLFLEVFDINVIKEMIEKQLSAKSFITIQCSDETVFNELYNYLIEEAAVDHYIEGETINYIENRLYYILNIFIP